MPPDLDGLELIELDLGGEPAYVPRRLPGGKTTWSHSSQALAERCPTQWKRRYLDRVEDPPSAAMLAGGAFGAALEHLYAAALLGETRDAERSPTSRRRASTSAPSRPRAGLAATREKVVDSARAYARERAPVIVRCARRRPAGGRAALPAAAVRRRCGRAAGRVRVGDLRLPRPRGGRRGARLQARRQGAPDPGAGRRLAAGRAVPAGAGGRGRAGGAVRARLDAPRARPALAHAALRRGRHRALAGRAGGAAAAGGGERPWRWRCSRPAARGRTRRRRGGARDGQCHAWTAARAAGWRPGRRRQRERR